MIFFDNREKSVFCFSWFSISMMPKFLIFLPFFLFAVTLWFHVFFFFKFHFLLSKFFSYFFYHNSSLLRIYLLFLGTWGDFLRWFRYLDFFSFRREIIMMSLCFFHMILRAQRRKKRIGLIFFWLGEQKKFFEWFFSRNHWSKWPLWFS